MKKSKSLIPVSTTAWVLSFLLLVLGLVATGLGFVTMFFPALWGTDVENLSPSQKYLNATKAFLVSAEYESFTNSTMKVSMKSERIRLPTTVKLKMSKSHVQFTGASEKDLGNVVTTSFTGSVKFTDFARGELMIRSPLRDNTKVKKQVETDLSFDVPRSTVSEMEIVCRNQHNCSNMSSNICNQGMTYHGSTNCAYNAVCGKCRSKSFLKRMCLLLDGPSPWKLSVPQGCMYPFDSPGEYVIERPDHVAIEVLCRHDPLILARNSTKGTMDFATSDDTPEGERKRLTFFLVGGAVVLVGLIATLISICLLTSFLRRRIPRNPVKKVVQSSSGYVESPPSPTSFTKPCPNRVPICETTQELVDPLNASPETSEPLRSSALGNTYWKAKSVRSSFSDML